MSTVELALLSRILILFRNPDKLLELLLLAIAETCFERSLSAVDELLLSDSWHFIIIIIIIIIVIIISYSYRDFTDHFSGPGKASGQCVCLGVWTIIFEL